MVNGGITTGGGVLVNKSFRIDDIYDPSEIAITTEKKDAFSTSWSNFCIYGEPDPFKNVTIHYDSASGPMGGTTFSSVFNTSYGESITPDEIVELKDTVKSLEERVDSLTAIIEDLQSRNEEILYNS